ncbi:hypothetical protein N7541_004941 [Penicillium brevicompactum]|uniref:Uncharacterized protein n=2 Tax=Penicillium brevicompactum TaxID=5074 RepID=A0A9W9RCP4_PENBR|nr:hypothetical protein N7541_004941 [Penicillium brevicompactum]
MLPGQTPNGLRATKDHRHNPRTGIQRPGHALLRKKRKGLVGKFDPSIGPGKGPDARLPLPDSTRSRIEVGFTYALQPASEKLELGQFEWCFSSLSKDLGLSEPITGGCLAREFRGW